MTNSATHPGDPDAVCRSCKFWDFNSDKDTDQIGRCRRRAPIPTITAKTDPNQEFGCSFFVWPMTHHGDWCGDWVWDEMPDEM